MELSIEKNEAKENKVKEKQDELRRQMAREVSKMTAKS